MQWKNVLLMLLVTSVWSISVQAEVAITENEGRITVTVDGQLFTEWWHGDWLAPYLYPVVGPSGQSVTRHYPMKDEAPDEDRDHPHHRSIRFSHRNVNGFSFWAPDSKAGGSRARIVLDEVEKIQSGETGELVLRNRWMGDDKLVLTETVRLSFIPLEKRQMLMDFDVSLEANGDSDVEFVDEKDGGLMVRVAGTMKVADRKTKVGEGTILTSRGDKNQEAWGKRAEWADYYGPDPSGKVAGVAIFDHPSNLRYPTHWHARTYGLITANRFGAGFFEAKNGATKGDGSYTIRRGDTLKLRHRLYIHLGDSESADVAGQYQKYLAGD